jgi:hypothetical protein
MTCSDVRAAGSRTSRVPSDDAQPDDAGNIRILAPFMKPRTYPISAEWNGEMRAFATTMISRAESEARTRRRRTHAELRIQGQLRSEDLGMITTRPDETMRSGRTNISLQDWCSA